MQDFTIAYIVSTGEPYTLGSDGYSHRAIARMAAEKINSDATLLPDYHIMIAVRVQTVLHSTFYVHTVGYVSALSFWTPVHEWF